MKKHIIVLTLASSFLSSTAFAGEYTESGYISEVSVNRQSNDCNIQISNQPFSVGFQGGEWKCNSTIGQNLLSVANIASILGLKVNVVLEGNGARYKPVLSINVINN
ncbi:hypothetical protein [Serratia fonticola]|uniref:hypothetical protein n=1 Tax=Serratia fonticola TaxID=47917 RepID=UPI0011C02DBA|nr:hypothetical protein [Serratia fonticola]